MYPACYILLIQINTKMVNKMKKFLKLSILSLFLPALAQAQQVPQFQEPIYYEEPVYYHPLAPQVQQQRSPIEQIVWNNKVRCGSDMSVKTYAHKEDGVWSGIDADLCRIIAQALLGDNRKIQMVNVSQKNMSRALDEDRIDIMLSGGSYSAKTETSRQALSAGFLYYDHQMLMVHKDDPEDLKEYKGKKICISTDSDYYKNFDDFNWNNDLGMRYLTFNTLKEAKEAFLLNRCKMMTASGLMLHGILQDLPGSNAKILPQQIALHPVYAYVQRDNAELRLALKWIFNALFLAEKYDINAQNLSFFTSNDNPEIRNLLGDDEQLWTDLKVKPGWLKEVVSLFGNYRDIFDKDLGEDSEYHLQRNEGKLVKDGGTIYPLPFM